jgi:hypothetical protein
MLYVHGWPRQQSYFCLLHSWDYRYALSCLSHNFYFTQKNPPINCYLGYFFPHLKLYKVYVYPSHCSGSSSSLTPEHEGLSAFAKYIINPPLYQILILLSVTLSLVSLTSLNLVSSTIYRKKCPRWLLADNWNDLLFLCYFSSRSKKYLLYWMLPICQALFQVPYVHCFIWSSQKKKNLWSRYYYYPHFIDKEAWKDSITCPRSHN